MRDELIKVDALPARPDLKNAMKFAQYHPFFVHGEVVAFVVPFASICSFAGWTPSQPYESKLFSASVRSGPDRARGDCARFSKKPKINC